MKKYSPEIKQKVLDFIRSHSKKEAINEFPEISQATIYRWAREENLEENALKNEENPLSSSMARLSLNSNVDLYEKMSELENKDRLFIDGKLYEFPLVDFEQKEIIADVKSMVKKCVHRPSKTECAMKFVSIPRVRNTDEDTARVFKNLQTEIKSLNDLRESKEAKNVIIEIFGFTFCEDIMGRRQLLICMELMDFDFKNLYQKSHKKDGHFPEPLLGHVIVSTIDALSYCRSKKIIHRDVKPVNILVKASTGEIKLCDFGLSRIIDRSSMSSMTGTIGYYAPEFFVRKKFDSRVDVWSVGITILECIKGKSVLIDHNGSVPKSHESMKECLELFNPTDEIDYYTARNYSMNLNLFLKAVLMKKPEDRPKYSDLKHYKVYQENKPTPKKAQEFQNGIISAISSIIDS